MFLVYPRTGSFTLMDLSVMLISARFVRSSTLFNDELSCRHSLSLNLNLEDENETENPVVNPELGCPSITCLKIDPKLNLRNNIHLQFHALLTLTIRLPIILRLYQVLVNPEVPLQILVIDDLGADLVRSGRFSMIACSAWCTNFN